jgi:hypothetical protein
VPLDLWSLRMSAPSARYFDRHLPPAFDPEGSSKEVRSPRVATCILMNQLRC